MTKLPIIKKGGWSIFIGTVHPSLVLQVVPIASNAFFAMSEFAVVSVNTQKMKRLAEGGSKPAARLLVITEAPSDFLATIQVGVTLSGFLASAAAADSFADPLVSALSFIPIPASTLRGVTVFLITIILSYFMLIFGELAPKRIAMKNPDGVALKVVGVIWALNKVCKPVIKLIAASTNLVLRPLGIGPASDEEPVAEEDILMMVEAGEEAGSLEPHERAMIENIFEFDDLHVSEVMTHRTEIVAVERTAPLAALVALQKEEVMHIPGLGFDGLVGYSPIALARNAVGMPMACEEYGASFFANGARPSGVREHPGVLKDPAKVRDSWNAVYRGTGNAHKVAVLEEGVRPDGRH